MLRNGLNRLIKRPSCRTHETEDLVSYSKRTTHSLMSFLCLVITYTLHFVCIHKFFVIPFPSLLDATFLDKFPHQLERRRCGDPIIAPMGFDVKSPWIAERFSNPEAKMLQRASACCFIMSQKKFRRTLMVGLRAQLSQRPFLSKRDTP
jgi:hypothetical protein